MLNDATCFKQIYIVCGYTDLRSGIDTLASIIDAKTDNSPFVPDTLYLFCGRKSDRIKGLVWEKDSLFKTICAIINLIRKEVHYGDGIHRRTTE